MIWNIWQRIVLAFLLICLQCPFPNGSTEARSHRETEPPNEAAPSIDTSFGGRVRLLHPVTIEENVIGLCVIRPGISPSIQPVVGVWPDGTVYGASLPDTPWFTIPQEEVERLAERLHVAMIDLEGEIGNEYRDLAGLHLGYAELSFMDDGDRITFRHSQLIDGKGELSAPKSWLKSLHDIEEEYALLHNYWISNLVLLDKLVVTEYFRREHDE